MKLTKIIIAGGRLFDDYDFLEESVWHIMGDGKHVIVSGGAKGADTLGELFAKSHGLKVEHHPADWYKYGRGAGFKRNLEMARSADMLVAFWDGKSKGTRGMIMDAIHEGLELHVYRYNEVEDTTEEEDA
jgi:hypothetical protein